jgi:hypothetical protein
MAEPIEQPTTPEDVPPSLPCWHPRGRKIFLVLAGVLS